MAKTIVHVVVLMLENRSFDHLPGFLKSPTDRINGLTGNESNPRDPSSPDSAPYVKLTNDANL